MAIDPVILMATDPVRATDPVILMATDIWQSVVVLVIFFVCLWRMWKKWDMDRLDRWIGTGEIFYRLPSLSSTQVNRLINKLIEMDRFPFILQLLEKGFYLSSKQVDRVIEMRNIPVILKLLAQGFPLSSTQVDELIEMRNIPVILKLLKRGFGLSHKQVNRLIQDVTAKLVENDLIPNREEISNLFDIVTLMKENLILSLSYEQADKLREMYSLATALRDKRRSDIRNF
jgi:hypothetical protein